MRSHPSCWNKTLAQLGFRRKRRKSTKRRDLYKRRSRFENLEQRQMLTVDPLLDPMSEEVVVSADATEEPIQFFVSGAEFHLIQNIPFPEELDGVPLEEVEPLFVVETVSGENGPRAILSFNPNYKGRIPSSLQKLQLELRQDARVIDSYEVLIDIAEEDFREQLLQDRIDMLSADLPEIELQIDSPLLRRGKIIDTAYLQELRTRYDAEINFIGPRTLEQIELLDQFAKEYYEAESRKSESNERVNLDSISTEELPSIAKWYARRLELLDDETTRLEIYDSVNQRFSNSETQSANAATAAERNAVMRDQDALKQTSMLLIPDLRKDMQSENAEVALAAHTLRGNLVAISDPEQVVFAGLGVDHEISRRIMNSGDEKAVSFIETGRYVFNDQLEVNLGEHPAMVQVTRLSRQQLPAATSVSESPAVEDGSTDEANDGTNGGTATSLHVNGTSGAQQETVIRFNLDDFGNPTTIQDAKLQLSEIGSSVGNAEVYVWNGILSGPTGSVTDWDETNVDWIHIDEDLGYSQRLQEFTQLSDWQSGTTTEVDVTAQIQRALLYGDANGDGVFGAVGIDGDIEAFHLAVTNWDAYVAEYGSRANSTADLLARTDGGLGDGTIDSNDIADFFRRHGYSRGDYNLDGTVQDNADSGIDGIDWARFNANYGLKNARFSQGDGDFDGEIGLGDYYWWYYSKDQDNLTSEEPEIVIWARPEDATTDIEFAAQEHAALAGPTLVVTEEPDLALNKFSVEGSNLVVDYAVLGDTFTDVKVQLYKVDSPDTLLHETAVQSGALGSHEVLIATSALSSIVEGDSVYAKVVGTPASGTQSNTANDELDFEFSTASTQTVTSLDDSGMDTVIRGKHTLRELIEANNILGWFDTLKFDNSLFTEGAQSITLGDHTGDNVADRLDISQDISIVGPGPQLLTIDARNQTQGVFADQGVTISLAGLRITGGNSAGHGAAIYNRGDLTIEQVVLQDNAANMHGGGIYNHSGGATLTVRNSVIDFNTAYIGGGISAFLPTGNSLVIEGSTISNNTTTGHSGGLSIVGATGTSPVEVSIINSTFSGNEAATTGGAIRTQTNTELKIVHSTITDNTASSSAGGVWSYPGLINTVHNSIIAGNHLTGSSVWATDASGNYGGTTSEPSTGNLVGIAHSGLYFDGNLNQLGTTALPIDPMLAPLDNYGGITTTHTLLEDSPAVDAGDIAYAIDNSGATLLVDQAGAARVSELEISSTSDPEELELIPVLSVGAVQFYRPPPRPDFDGRSYRPPTRIFEFEPIIVTSLADVGVAGKLTLRDALNLASIRGGSNAIYFDDSLFDGSLKTISLEDQRVEESDPRWHYSWVTGDDMADSLVVKSDVIIVGPGADQLVIDGKDESRVFVLESGNVELANLAIERGSTQSDGGGIWHTSTAGNLTLSNVAIRNNQAEDEGAAIYFYGGADLVIEDSSITDNGSFDTFADGAITFRYGGNLELIRSSIEGNRAQLNAGIGANSASIRVLDSTIAENISSLQVGGFYLKSSDAHFYNSTISGNQTDYSAGGVSLVDTTSSFTNVTIVNNHASNGVGGVLESNSANLPILHNSIVAQNTTGDPLAPVASDLGGAFSNASSHNLIGDPNSAGNITDGGATENIVGNAGASVLDPRLGSLVNNGGSTRTHALLPTSDAIDAGSELVIDGFKLTEDQRGTNYQRIVDYDGNDGADNIDIGAFELSVLDLDNTSDGIHSEGDFIVGEGPVAIAPFAEVQGAIDEITVSFVGAPPYHYESGTDILLVGSNPGSLDIEYLQGQVTLSGSASIADYQQTLRSITYNNVEVSPHPAARQLQVDVFYESKRISSASATIQPKYRDSITYYGIEDISTWAAPGGEDTDPRSAPNRPSLYVAATGENTTYLKFPLPAQVTNVTDATLTLHTFGSTSTVDVYAYHDDWSESSLPGKLNLPDVLSLHRLGSVTGGVLEFEQEDASALANGDGYFSVVLVDNDAPADGLTQIASSETSKAYHLPKLTINGLFTNNAPEAEPDIYFRELGDTQPTIQVSAEEGVLINDSDPDGDAGRLSLRAVLDRQPFHGTVQLGHDGSFTYRADDSFYSTDSFRYRAFDGISYSDPRTVTIQQRDTAGEEYFPYIDTIAYSVPPATVQSYDGQSYINARFSPVNESACDDWLDSDYEGYGGDFSGIDYSMGAVPGHRTEVTYRFDHLLNTVTDPVAEIGRATVNLGLPGHKNYFEAFQQLRSISYEVGTPLPPVFPFSCIGDDQPWDTPPMGAIWAPVDESWSTPSYDVSQSSGGWSNDVEPHAFDSGVVDVTEYLRAAIAEGDSTITIGVQGTTHWTTHLEPRGLTVTFTTEPGSPADPTPQPNYRPYFTSTPESEVTIGNTFEYEMGASDPDGDIAELGLPISNISWPAGFTPAPEDLPTFTPAAGTNKADVHWTPPVELIGETVTFTEFVRDDFGHLESRTFDVYVRQDPQNQPPVIIADPSRQFVLPDAVDTSIDNNDDVSPEAIDIFLAEGQKKQVGLSVDLSQEDPRSEIVFVIDSTGSMSAGFKWIYNVLPDLDLALENEGFSFLNRAYGLTTFPGHTLQFPDSEYWGTAEELRTLVGGIVPDGDGEYGYDALGKVLGLNSPNVGDSVYDFKGNSNDPDSSSFDPRLTSSQIVLITDDTVQGFTSPTPEEGKLERAAYRDSLLSLLKGSEADFDDILLTTVVNARYDAEVRAEKPAGFEEVQGTWSLSEDAYHANANGPDEWAISVADAYLENNYYYSVRKSLKVPLSITPDNNGNGNAFIIFNYRSETDYKFVAAFTSQDQPDEWRIGHRNANGIVYEPPIYSDEGIRPNTVYDVDVGFGRSSISLSVNGREIGGYKFSDLTGQLYDGRTLYEGKVGVGTLGSTASFLGLSVTSDKNSSLEVPPESYRNENLRHDFGYVAQAFPAMGYTNSGVAYFAESSGQYSKGYFSSIAYSLEASDTLHNESSTLNDYIALAAETNGSVWDQSLLRGIGQNPDSNIVGAFSSAFGNAVSYQAKLSLGLVELDSLTTPSFVSLAPRSDSPGAELEGDYTATFEGDGASHFFQLDVNQGEIHRGRIPVRILAPYVAYFDANDPDGPPDLTFSWAPGSWTTSDPEHMPQLANSGRDGFVNDRMTWIPPIVTENTDFKFGITVHDGLNLETVEEFWWTVTIKPPEPNTKPIIDGFYPLTDGVAATDPPNAQIGVGYYTRVAASDANNDRLRYFLDGTATPPPSNMVIDPNTGEIFWIPTETGSFDVTVRVADGRATLLVADDPLTPNINETVYGPDEATLTFNITVDERTFSNLAPTVEPIPSGFVFVGETLAHPTTASDPNGHPLTYKLQGEPDWMSITEKGVITGTPTVDHIDTLSTVTVTVDDGHGKQDSQTFQVAVLSANRDPEFRSTPHNAGKDLDFAYRLEVYDPDGNVVNLHLEDPPEGMKLEQRADGWYVVWLREDMTVDRHTVKVIADDGQGGRAEHVFDLEVQEISAPVISGNIQVRVTVDPNVTDEYESVLSLTSGVPIPDLAARLATQTNITLDPLSVARGMSIDIDNVVEVQQQDNSYLYEGIRILWDPSYSDVFKVVVTASNGAATSTLPFEIEVFPEVAINSGPAIQNSQLGPFAVGEEFDLTLDILDPDGHDVANVEILPGTTIPNFSSANVNHNGTPGHINWTPSEAGDFVLVLRATDSINENEPIGPNNRLAQPTVIPIHVSPNAPTKIHYGAINFPPFYGQRFSYPFSVSDANEQDTITVTINDEAAIAGLELVPPSTSDVWHLVWQNPGPIGSETFVRIEATDGRGQPQAFSFTLPVFDPESKTAPLQPSGIGPLIVPFGRKLTHRVLAPGAKNNRPTFSIQPIGGAPPESLPAVSDEGEIRWSPTFDDTGGIGVDSIEYEFELTLDYNPLIESDDIAIPLTLVAVKPEDFSIEELTISSKVPGLAVEGRLLSYVPKAEGGVGQVSWSAGDGTPSDVSVDPHSGTVNWMPNAEDVGTVTTIYLLATDALQQSSLQEITLEVVGAGIVPQINSSFPKLWPVGREFSFPVVSRNPNGGELGYRLLELSGDPIAPGKWNINSDLGIVSWATPLEGQHHFVIEVYDRNVPELSTRQQIDIDVSGTGYLAKPIITDLPYGRVASIGSQFEHNLRAWDPDGVVSKWEILSGQPTEGNPVFLHSTTGQLLWTPSSEHENETYTLKIRASDGQPGGLRAEADIDLTAVRNEKPIVSLPSLKPTVGTDWVFNVDARDPEGGELTFEIQNAPHGMTIDETSGQVRWKVPQTVPLQQVDFDLIVTDDLGLAWTQLVTVDVQPDLEAPTVNFWIEDADGNVVPVGGTLDADLENDSDPTNDYKIWFTIEDNLGEGQDELNWLLEVVDSAGLNIEGNDLFKTSDTRGGTASTSFQGGLNSGLLFFTFTLGDADVSSIIMSNPQEGVLPEDITGNVGTQTFKYNVSNSTQETYAQLLNVDSPDNVLVVDERFEIRGIANYEISQNNFAWYDLKLASVDDPDDFVHLIRNADAEFGNDSVIGVIDPTLVKSGQYRLYLEVRSTQDENCQCIAGIDEQIIEIRNDSRLGNLDLSFTDLSVDLGGIPISLVRSYSSALLGEGDVALGGDFGPGWTLNFLQAGIEVGHPDQTTTNFNEPFAERTRLLVELPDGSIHRFEFDVESVGSTDTGPFRPIFQPDPDVASTLELANQNEALLLVPNTLRQDGSFVSSSTNKEFLPANFGSALVLTTQAGLRYLFDTETGKLTAIEDTNNRRITATHDQALNQLVLASENNSVAASEQIVVQFDAEGRITWIDDPLQQEPSNQRIEYFYGDYDPADGSLVSNGLENLGKVVRRNGDRVVYNYDNAIYERHLTAIHDNSGIKVLTATYYDDISQVQDPPGQTLTDKQKETYLGRLWDLQDASGQGAGLSFDIDLGDGRMVTRVDDGFGIEVDEVTNNRGNVLRRVQLVTEDLLDSDNNVYLVTKFEYNNRGLLTHQSVPYTVVGVTNRYDSDQDPSSDLMATGYDRSRWSQIITYDAKDRTQTTSDALGNTTTFEYDDEDRVIKTTDPNDTITHNVYDPYNGNLLETYATEGDNTQKHNHSKFFYDSYGRITKTYQVDGSREVAVSETHYDQYGRVAWTKETDQNTATPGLKRYFGYDTNGNQTHSWSNWTDADTPTNKIATVSVTKLDAEGRSIGTEEHEVSGEFTNDSQVDFDNLKNALSTATLLWKTTTSYDSQGRINQSIDRYGNITETMYDIRSNVIESRTKTKQKNDTVGWLITRTLYDAQGRVLFSADPYFVAEVDYNNDENFDSDSLLGSYTHYDDLGRVDRSERHSGVDITLELNSGTVDVTTDLTTSTTYDFDLAGAYDSRTTTHYDDIGRIEYTVSETNARTDNYYDVTGRQIATLGPLVTVDDTQQRLLSISEFDAGGRLLQSTTGISITETADQHPALDDLLNPGWEKRSDENRQDTFYEYDTAGRQTAVITTAIDNPDYNSSGPTGAFDTIHEHIHLRTETTYDGLGHRIASITGIKQAIPSDPATIDRTHQRETNYEYDNAGNLTAVILPAVEHPETMAMVRPRYEYTYDIYGNRLTIRDNVYQNPTTGDVYYDHHGTENDFSADFDTRVTVFEYDHRGQQTARTLPELQSESMHYSNTALDLMNPADRVSGQLEYSVSFEGKVTAYYYDNTEQGGGRLVEKRYYDSVSTYDNGNGTAAETVSYEYDEFGRQVEVDDSARGLTINVYDLEGQLTKITTPEGTINYAYDPATGNQVRSYTDKTDVTYGYNDLGQLTSMIVTKRDIHDSANYVNTLSGGNESTTYHYDLKGQLDYEVLPSGSTRDLLYDELGRPDKIEHFVDLDADGKHDANERMIASFDYAYDVHNKQSELFEEIDTNNDGTLDAVHRYLWRYDDLGRLVEESFDDGDNGNSTQDYVDRFKFDLVGNRLKKEKDQEGSDASNFTADQTTDYTYDSNDRVLTEVFDAADPADDTNTIYEYGANATTVYGGDHTTQTAKTIRSGKLVGQGSTVETQSLEYDRQGRLDKVTTTKSGNTTISEYDYDDGGFRISQTVGGVKTVYLVDPNNHTGYAQTLEERDAAGNVTKTYSIGLDVVTEATAIAAYHLLYDAHGSTRAVMDSSTGSAVQFYVYDAYGKLVDLSGFTNAIQNAIVSLLYSGEFRDGNTGWDYLRARWYQGGVFNRLDPFEGDFFNPQSLHKMLYTHGDPVNGIDPTGESLIGTALAVSIGTALTGAVAGAAGNALYAYLKNGNSNDIFKAAAYGFGAGFAAGLTAGSLIAALGYAAAAGGGSAAAGYWAGGFIVSSASLGPAIENVEEAFENGDGIDQGFAIAGLTGSAAGIFASHLSVWNLLSRGGPASRAAIAAQTSPYRPDRWLDTKASRGNIVIASVPSQSPGGKFPNFYTVLETLQASDGNMVNATTFWQRLQVNTGRYGPRDRVGIYRFKKDTTIARGVTRANGEGNPGGNFGAGGYPQFYVKDPGGSLEFVRALKF